MRVEHPFGHIKRNLGVGAFLLRGLEGVNAEINMLGTCFNIARMISFWEELSLQLPAQTGMIRRIKARNKLY